MQRPAEFLVALKFFARQRRPEMVERVTPRRQKDGPHVDVLRFEPWPFCGAVPASVHFAYCGMLPRLNPAWRVNHLCALMTLREISRDARDGHHSRQAVAAPSQARRVPDEGPLRARDLRGQGARFAQARVAIFSPVAPHGL